MTNKYKIFPLVSGLHICAAAVLLLLSGCSPGEDDPPPPIAAAAPLAPPILENPSFVPTATDLPVVVIATQGGAPIVSKDDYLSAQMTITNVDSTVAFQGSTQIRGRGNTTWGMPKKPYKLKLGTKSALLGMPADKDWALLANYSDKSLIRQQLAYETGARFGMAWSPRARNVEVFLNSQYLGVYTLVETIDVDTNRVNIKELGEDDTTADKISGGYLMEIDDRMDDPICFRSTLQQVAFCIKEPEAIVPAQLAYIQGSVQQTENVLYGDMFADPEMGYAHYIDVDSFVNWYLVNELFKNNDAAFYSSVYIYKNRDGKLTMGPVWDFDIGAGNIDYNNNQDPTGWWIRNAHWYARLFEDPAFVAKVQTRWRQLRHNEIATLTSFVDDRAALLQLGQSNNFQRWLILDKYVPYNALVPGSYGGEVSYLKSWLTQRIAWLDLQFGS